MKVHFQGTDYELDLSDVNLKPAMVIQGYTGLSIDRWVDSMTSETDALGNITKDATQDPVFLKSLGAVYWLMLQQNGTVCPIADVDFPVGAFGAALGDAFAAETEALAAQGEPVAEDPTRTPGLSSASSQEPPSTPAPEPWIPDPQGPPDG